MIRAALVYASWGWYVHPLRPGDKRPLLTNWPQRATTDPEKIRGWWGRWPAANIGLACGPSGLLAVDLDVKHGVDGLAAWEALKAELGFDDAGTPVSDTPSGGRHVLFSQGDATSPGDGTLPDGQLLGNTAGKLGPGIDTRGDGGYIVLPPSRLASPAGAEHRAQPGSSAAARPAGEASQASPRRGAGTWAWRAESHPRHCRPQPLPQVLWQRLVGGPGTDRPAAVVSQPRAPAGAGPATGVAGRSGGSSELGHPNRLEGITAYAKAALRAEVRRVATAPQGTRNDTLNAAAFSLGQLVAAGLLEPAQVERPLALGAQVAGLNGPEALATIRSGLVAGQGQPRQPPVRGPTPHHLDDAPAGATGPPAAPAPPGDFDLLAEGADDEGNAQCVAHLHGERFLYCSAFGWMKYTGSHWTRDPKGVALGNAVVDTLKARHSLALKAERPAIAKVTVRSNHRVKAAKGLLPGKLYVEPDQFDASADHLNVANGVLDLRTGTLLPHGPAQRFTYCLPVAYEAGTDYGPWRDWLRQVLAAAASDEEAAGTGDGATAQLGDGAAAGSAEPGEAEELYLQLAAGYSLTGHTSEEVLFYLCGPPRAGKGTFTEALLAVLGPEPLATEVPFGLFVRSRTADPNSADLARLKPCRLVVASEPGKDEWLNAAELKRMTGGNLIFAALKFREHFAYRPAFKIWLVGNEPPQADVGDTALWGRLRVIPFPNSYAGQEDRSLKARMKAPEMQRQILAWAVDGARAWYRTLPRGLPTPPSIEAATQAARDELDYVGQWLAECVQVTGARDDFVPNGALRASYDAWCRRAGAPSCGARRLTQALKAKGLPAGAKAWHQGRTQRGCHGVRLRG